MNKGNIFNNFILCSNSFFLASSKFSNIWKSVHFLHFLLKLLPSFFFLAQARDKDILYSEGKNPRTSTASSEFIRGAMFLITYKRQTVSVFLLRWYHFIFIFEPLEYQTGEKTHFLHWVFSAVCFQAVSAGMIN